MFGEWACGNAARGRDASKQRRSLRGRQRAAMRAGLAATCSYLGALHEKGIANADHTTLLLNCYTKVCAPALIR
jgi:hypothetical protein